MAATTAAIVAVRRRRPSLSRPSSLNLSVLSAGRRLSGGRVSVKSELGAQARRSRYRCLFNKYDVDGTGTLSRAQFMRCITDLENLSASGQPPNHEEIDCMLRTLGLEDAQQESSKGAVISVRELEQAVLAWITFKDNRDMLDKVFDDFVEDGTGILAKSQLKAYLKCVGGGDVTEEEVAWVYQLADFNKTGELQKLDTTMAAMEWYARVKIRERDTAVEPPDKGCCVVT